MKTKDIVRERDRDSVTFQEKQFRGRPLTWQRGSGFSPMRE